MAEQLKGLWNSLPSWNSSSKSPQPSMADSSDQPEDQPPVKTEDDHGDKTQGDDHNQQGKALKSDERRKKFPHGKGQGVKTLGEVREVKTLGEGRGVKTQGDGQVQVKTLGKGRGMKTQSERQRVKTLGEGQRVKTQGEGQRVKTLGEGQGEKIQGEGQEVNEGLRAKTLGEGQGVKTQDKGQRAKTLGEGHEGQRAKTIGEGHEGQRAKTQGEGHEGRGVKTQGEGQKVKTQGEGQVKKTQGDDQQVKTKCEDDQGVKGDDEDEYQPKEPKTHDSIRNSFEDFFDYALYDAPKEVTEDESQVSEAYALGFVFVYNICQRKVMRKLMEFLKKHKEKSIDDAKWKQRIFLVKKAYKKLTEAVEVENSTLTTGPATQVAESDIMKKFENYLTSLVMFEEAWEVKKGGVSRKPSKSQYLISDAYSLLMKASRLDANKPPKKVPLMLEKQLQKMIPNAKPEKLAEDSSIAVQIAWDMLMLQPPEIVCMPEKYSKAWHEDYGQAWDSSKPSHPHTYFRPLLFLGAGGSVATRAIVGNIKSSVALIKESEEGIASSDSDIEEMDGDIIVLPEEYNESFFDEGEAAAAAAIQNPPTSDEKMDPIGSPKWCRCGHCVQTGKNSFCCHDMFKGKGHCVTEEKWFPVVCLNVDVLATASFTIKHIYPRDYDRSLYQMAHFQFLTRCHCALFKHPWNEPLPSCVHAQFLKQFKQYHT